MLAFQIFCENFLQLFNKSYCNLTKYIKIAWIEQYKMNVTVLNISAI